MNLPRRLTERDRPSISAFLSNKLDTHVFVSQRLLGSPIENQIALGIMDDDVIQSMVFISGNAVPISVSPEAASLYANTTYVKYAQFASIVGEAHDVTNFWHAVSQSDGTRTVASERKRQPYLLLEHSIPIEGDLSVDYITHEDFEQFYNASHSMFLGEVGRAPYNLETYRSRLFDQVQDKRSLGYFDEVGVLRFKVDVPIVYKDVCQVQGVWMHPEWRGQGKSAPLFSEAIALIQRDIARRVTLYVNDFNEPALRLYRRLGFNEIAEYSTVFLDI
jgi:predicted GNAT family acetyltransferase